MKRELRKALDCVYPGTNLKHSAPLDGYKLASPLKALANSAFWAARDAEKSLYQDDLLAIINKVAYYAKCEHDYAEQLRLDLQRHLERTPAGGRAPRRPTEDWHSACLTELAKLLARSHPSSLTGVARALQPKAKIAAKKNIAVRTIREFLSKDRRAQHRLRNSAGN
jgi:hypothetical protein